MGSIVDALRGAGVLVSDGAWGTFLHQKGLPPGHCPEEWNLSRPEEVYDIARRYVEAGADLIETNSFGGTSFKLASYGLGHRVAEINAAAAQISRRAAGDRIHVLGSMGPTGKLLMMGEATPQELYQAFREQAMALEAGGANALAVETMADLEEAKIAVRACLESTRCEVICTMTFEPSGPGEYHTLMGVTPEQMVAELVPAGAHAVGANCGNGMAGMVEVVRRIRRSNGEIPILVHANAGLPQYREGQTVYPEGPDAMAQLVPALVSAGASIIGGCCGTTPEHIRAIARMVKRPNPPGG